MHLRTVIFLSAHAGAEARVEALLQGADDYLVRTLILVDDDFR